jgi:hypothetical protein
MTGAQDISDWPSLIGAARDRIESHNWACAVFAKANREVEHLIARRQWREAANADNAILAKLEEWEPSTPTN